MHVRILGAHSSAAGFARCVSLLIDNCLAIDAGSVASALSITEQSKLEAVLLSHQHYDHVRDLPPLALNLFRQDGRIAVYGTRMALHNLDTHLFNGEIFPRFQRIPEGSPTLHFREINPLENTRVCGYEVRAIPVNHGARTMGYMITDALGGNLFYTADTGPGLGKCWQDVRPQVLLIEVTLPNRYQDYAIDTGHLTPALLLNELSEFRGIRGYMPHVVALHMDPSLEEEIVVELERVAEDLETPITVAYEGMEFKVEHFDHINHSRVLLTK